MKPRKTPTKSPKPAGKGPMDVDLLQQIVKIMAANDLSAVDLRDGTRRVVVHRGRPAPQGAVYAPATMAAMPAAPPPTPFPATASARGADTPAGNGDDAGLIPIKSPMVGTFYTSSSPDAKAFVAVGDKIDEETDICIIEAMKVFNNIKAETRGTIARILATNGQAVEFGQVLFLVKP